MSKTTENVLLVPGESGWEIWSGPSTAALTLHSATTIDKAGDLTDIPAGDLLLLFPVKAITAVPMRVSSDDDALFADLAALHAERIGLRPDPMAGQLTDHFIIAREPENTALVSVYLRVPGEGDMPPRGPKSFDISARAFPVTGDTLAVWKELGRWVFALFHQGNLVYCQATSVTAASPDEDLAREIRLALMQLGLQGMEIEPTRVVVWTSLEITDTSALAKAFQPTPEVTPRPAPVLPDPLSKLLPADVRAARREARRKQNIMLGVAAVALIYVGIIGWFGYGLWKNNSETQALIKQAQEAAPEGEAYALHMAKWDELADAIELGNSPVEILKNIASCIPPNSGLRLRTADISASEIKLIGEAQQLQSVTTFNLNLTKNQDLSRFEWQNPEPNQSTRGWEFVYTGQLPGAQN
ncbi:hypothetical protein JIN84_11045 [Luteolibacter yonseiensis]|uniref:Uncharacterized protein n=1 Tax=Luteolibacter yonseiensis TaxID=1144680 RepID=A0A934R657_9BACT|nr:hypothetical protein [Luteolibacter yonseiensis]MBK1816150.1 hypothetical protein [Luteolibacter yonseiensis]